MSWCLQTKTISERIRRKKSDDEDPHQHYREAGIKIQEKAEGLQKEVLQEIERKQDSKKQKNDNK